MTTAKPSTNKSLFCSIGSPDTAISNNDVRQQVDKFLASLGERRDVLILPPDFTRFHSQAGLITRYISEYYNFTPKENDNGSSSDGGGNEEEEQPSTPSCPPAIQIMWK